MRIVNQDRTLSINSDLYDITVFDEAIRAYFHGEEDACVVLGEYKTPEIASYIFEDIHRTINDKPNRKVIYMPKAAMSLDGHPII
jgi:hypothetical protein